LEASGPVQASNGIALPFPLPIIEVRKAMIAAVDLQTPSAPTNAQLCILYVLLLIYPYIFCAISILRELTPIPFKHTAII
jgi:hypothetical protein